MCFENYIYPQCEAMIEKDYEFEKEVKFRFIIEKVLKMNNLI